MRKSIFLFAVLFSAAASANAQQPAAPESAEKAQPNCSELPALKQQVDYMNARFGDWPDLARYREANAQLGVHVSGVGEVEVLVEVGIGGGLGKARSGNRKK